MEQAVFLASKADIRQQTHESLKDKCRETENLGVAFLALSATRAMYELFMYDTQANVANRTKDKEG
jgi:hypothetical protein